MRHRAPIFIGQKSGRLTVIEVGPAQKRRRCLCRCECGTEKWIMAQSIKSGASVSCGCYRLERATAANRKHGETRHPLFKLWFGMLQRCGNPDHPAYSYYGARGITVCPEWADDFGTFLRWATLDVSPMWRRGMTLDRIDNDGEYSPRNCRWATMAEQNRNKRKTKKYDFNGEQLVATDIAKRLGISAPTFIARVGWMGWPIERAISEPVHRKRTPS